MRTIGKLGQEENQIVTWINVPTIGSRPVNEDI